jgi:hypothetical protein
MRRTVPRADAGYRYRDSGEAAQRCSTRGTAKHASEVAFVEHDDEIEAFAANRADDVLGDGILPGSARCDDDLANAHVFDPALEVSTVDDDRGAGRRGGSRPGPRGRQS